MGSHSVILRPAISGGRPPLGRSRLTSHDNHAKARCFGQTLLRLGAIRSKAYCDFYRLHPALNGFMAICFKSCSGI